MARRRINLTVDDEVYVIFNNLRDKYNWSEWFCKKFKKEFCKVNYINSKIIKMEAELIELKKEKEIIQKNVIEIEERKIKDLKEHLNNYCYGCNEEKEEFGLIPLKENPLLKFHIKCIPRNKKEIEKLSKITFENIKEKWVK